MSSRPASRWRTGCRIRPTINLPGAVANTLFGNSPSGASGSPANPTTGSWAESARCNCRCCAMARAGSKSAAGDMYRLSRADSVASANPPGATRNAALAVGGPTSRHKVRAWATKTAMSPVSIPVRSCRGALAGCSRGERLLHQRPAHAQAVRAFAEHLPESTPAALAREQTQPVAAHAVERHAARELCLHVGPQCTQQLAARAQHATEPGDIDPMQQVGVVICGPSQHGAVGMREVRAGFGRVGDSAVDHDLELGTLALEPPRPVVAQRRHLAVLLRRESLEPCVARMHHEDAATC